MPHLFMIPRHHSRWRLLPLLGALLLRTVLPARAHAQCTGASDEPPECDDGSGPGGDSEPYVSISPPSLKTSQPSVPVTITMSDNLGLVDSTFHVYVNGGTDARSNFSFTKTTSGSGMVRARATATGLVQLSTTGPTVGKPSPAWVTHV